MNDRAVSLLDQYELEIIRTRKGRGSIICESTQGLFLLKEYSGSLEKAAVLDRLLTRMQESCKVSVECILKNKEGALITQDTDGSRYLVKSWFEGRECNIRDPEECIQAVRTLAELHKSMVCDEEESACLPVQNLKTEYERHNKELRRVRRFLKAKSQKTDFEIFLNRQFDPYLEQAEQVLAEWETYAYLEQETELQKKRTLCHGDYQYHNLIMVKNDLCVVNFEHLALDCQIRDLYLFLRKLLEKNNWSCHTGEKLLQAYDRVRPLSAADRIGLLYRFAYPEKFWKIVNFYYNSTKSWIPGKNMEKLQKVLNQEKEKQRFLNEVLRTL